VPIWFAIAGLFAIMLWPYAFGGAIIICALPVFYLITLILKKEQVFATVLFVLGIVGVTSSAIFLLFFISEGVRIIFLLDSPIMGVVALMVVSLVFHIGLLRGTAAYRKEARLLMLESSEMLEDTDFDNIIIEKDADDPPRKKPLHVASFLFGIFAVMGAFLNFFYGMICVVCGAAGLILAIRARARYKMHIGLVLSIIGLSLGVFYLIYSAL